jgi:hypothetical protein
MADEPETFDHAHNLFPGTSKHNKYLGAHYVKSHSPPTAPEAVLLNPSDSEQLPQESATDSESMDDTWNSFVHVKIEPVEFDTPPPFPLNLVSPDSVSADLSHEVSAVMVPVDSVVEIQQAISYEVQVMAEPAEILTLATAHPKAITVLSQATSTYSSIIHDMESTVERVRAESKAFVDPLKLMKVRSRICVSSPSVY